MPRPARHGAWRWAKRALFAVLGLIVLLALLLVVALRTSFAREQVRTRVNVVLSELFQGKVVIDRLSAITFSGVSGVDARVFDPAGKQVIRVQGLSVVTSLPRLGWQLVAHSDNPELAFAVVHVDHADVTLRDDEEVGVSVGAAFLPRPTPGVPPAPSDPTSGPHLHLDRVQFDHIWAHGLIGSSFALDAELTRLVASLVQSPKSGLQLDLRGVSLLARALPGDPEPRGQAAGKLAIPADPLAPLQLEGKFSGRAAGSPAEIEARWQGDELHGTVSLPELPAEFVNQRLQGLRLDGHLDLHASVDGTLPMLDFTAGIVGAAAQIDARGYAVVAQGLEVAATVEATRIDPARIAPDAPRGDLHLQLMAFAFEDNDGEFVGCQRLDLWPGSLGGNATPPLWVNGKGRVEPTGEVSASGALAVDDQGLAVRGQYGLALPRDPGGVVAANLNVQLNDPARLKSWGVSASGHGELSAELRLAEHAITGQATLRLRHLDHSLVQARNIEMTARASGTLEQPRVRAATALDVLSGHADARLDYSPAHQDLALSVSDLDLVRLSRALGSKVPVEHASLNAAAHVTRHAAVGNYEVDAKARVALGKLGSAQLTATDLELPSSLGRRTNWSNLKGALAIDGQVRLEELSPLLTQAGLPIERTTGNVRFEVASKNERGNPDGLELSVSVDTMGLRVVERREAPKIISTTADARASQPLAIEGIDVHFSAHARPKSGEMFGTVLLRDAEGTLAEVQAETQLPESLALLSDSQALAQTPLKVRLQVPRRRLGRLPPLLRPAALRGRLALDASLEGSLTAPRFEAQVSALSLRAAGSKAPVDVTAEVHYAPEGGKCHVEAKLAGQSARVASVEASWQGDLRRAASQGVADAGLVGNVDAALAELPLDVLPFLLDRQVRGRLSGKLLLEDWGQNAKVKATFDSNSLTVGNVSVSSLAASAKTEGNKLLADVAMKVGGGTAQASLDASMQWGKRPLPELARQGKAKLAAHAFDLATLNPLLAAYVSEIGGMLEAQTELVVTPSSTELSGSAKLENGVLQVPALGQRFSDIHARIAVADRQFKVEDLSARGTTGRVTGRASASLDGFALRGAEAHVTITENESLPLTLEGVTLGDVSGSVDAKYASSANGERKLDIELPELHLVTPEASGYGLQSLDVPADIRVGVRRADGTFATLPVQPLDPSGADDAGGEQTAPLHIRVRLGDNVTVERGRSAKAQLGGEITIVSGVQADVKGRIEVKGGSLDVQGKRFEIERGVVTFEGDDPSNPTITATARWDAPEYTVYADYVGDVKNGHIKLRSEPPLTPTEIANLLLLGSPEGSSAGSSDPTTGSLAVGLAGDTAAKGLNQVLDDFTNLDVSARIDTTTGNARPELVFQVSPRVSARVTRAIGAPAAGQALDRTFLTLELRLRRAWALSAVFGDHGGSALDLIWRRRY